jgi:CRP-like cAMP-binding protein
VERSDFRRGMEMGADDFITKPFDDIELLNAIEVRLRKQDVLHQKYNGGEEGVKEFMHNLQESGMIKLDPNDYETVQFSKRQMVYSEGKRPKFLYYVRAGKVKTFRLNEDGKEYITNLYSAGDYFGYISLLENTAYDDNAEVLEDADLALIGREDFVQAVFNDMTIAGKFIRLISQNVKEKEDRLLHLAYDSLRKRVAKALVDIHQKFNGNENSSALDIPREDIAQYVGTATESLIRTLSDFKSEKLIEIKEGKIRITDLARLSNLLY